MAQGLLPASGVDVRVGNLRSQLERAYAAGPPLTTPGWTFTPTLDVEAIWSDPVQGIGGSTGRPLGGDVYTVLSPGISVFGQSQRLQGGLFLAPTFRAYATHGNLNSYNTNFTGQAHGIILQDEVFLDLTGSSGMQSRNGGMSSSSSLSRNDTVQNTTFMLAPSAQHQFGDYGTAKLGASLGQTSTDALASTQSNSPFAEPLSNTPMVSKEVHASFRTGEILGQTAAELHTSQSQRNGGGALRNSARSSTALDIDRYLDRDWTLLTSFGVEDIRYGGLTPIRHNNATWSGGVRWVPNADSTIIVSYGRHDAGTSLLVDATYAATARTRFSLNYSEGISTGQEDAQNAVAGSTINSAGQLIDRRTGLPIYGNNNYFGAQTNSAYRFKRASATGSLVYDRDVFTLSLRKDDRTLLSAATTGVPGASSGVYADLAVQHDLNPGMSASAFIEIGQRQTPGLQTVGARTAATQDTRSLGATFSVGLSETLSARMQYSYTSITSNIATLNQTQNMVMIGLHKTF
jgi:uncharacterized protein (PEP-CTERM system associated)